MTGGTGDGGGGRHEGDGSLYPQAAAPRRARRGGLAGFSLVFLAAGILAFRLGAIDFEALKGVLVVAFALAALSLVVALLGLAARLAQRLRGRRRRGRRARPRRS